MIENDAEFPRYCYEDDQNGPGIAEPATGNEMPESKYALLRCVSG